MKKNVVRFPAVTLTAACATIALVAAPGAAGKQGSTQAKAARPLTVAADPSLLPYNFYASGTKWTGINIDIGKALSKAMKRRIVFKAAPFSTIIPGLQARRYDFALTGMFDTKEREKVLDFIDYLKAKNNFLILKSNSLKVSSFDDICGLKVGLNAGSLEVQLTSDAATKCKQAGKPAPQPQIYPDLNSATLALLSGRVDVLPNDSATNAYQLKHNPGKFKVTGVYLNEGYFALGVRKHSALFKPLLSGMRKIQKNGSLKKILKRWGVADRGTKILTNHGL